MRTLPLVFALALTLVAGCKKDDPPEASAEEAAATGPSVTVKIVGGTFEEAKVVCKDGGVQLPQKLDEQGSATFVGLTSNCRIFLGELQAVVEPGRPVECVVSNDGLSCN